MLLFYIRHGDPNYHPDELTPLGKKQAEAVAKRLSLYGVDKVYASSSNRAQQTAKPTCEILKLQPEIVPFASEDYAWHEFTFIRPDGRRSWCFAEPEYAVRFNDPRIWALGRDWYRDECFKDDLNFGSGQERVQTAVDEFMKNLGYEHVLERNGYKAVAPNEKRVALFAHEGFGKIFMSCLLDVPYPMFCSRFEMSHSGMTVIEFKDRGDELIYPKVLTYASDSHLYREGLPTNYQNRIRF